MAAVLAQSEETTTLNHTATRRPRRRLGFTLIETSLATIIVGVGVLAMVSAQMAFHQKNQWSTHASIATHLANELREMTWTLPQNDPVTGDAFWGPEGDNEASLQDYDDLDDFDGLGGGLVFAPPINARREVISNMDGWSQTVRVFNVDPFNIIFDGDTLMGVQPDGTTDTMAVEVTIHYLAPNETETMEMTRVTWISPK